MTVDNAGNGHFVWQEEAFLAGGEPIHYCRVPRGGRACAVQQRLSAGDAGLGLHVFSPVPNVVVIVSHRCCSLRGAPNGQNRAARTVMYLSTDGGNTFAAPRVIGTLNSGGEEGDIAGANGDAALGPGQDRISLMSSRGTGGIAYQAAPVAGYTESAAVLGRFPGGGYAGQRPPYASVGFVSPATPIAAYTLADYQNVFFRVWAGGDYNSPSGWKPQQLLARGDEPYLASGQRGVFALHRTSKLGDRGQYVVRRFNPGSGAFGPPIGVSEVGEPAWRDFHQDGSGRLHAVWLDRVARDDPLRYRSSIDGTNWSAIQTLLPKTDGILRPEIGAAPDGKGWVTYDTGGPPAAGPLLAAPIELDTTAPTISGLSMTKRRFRVARRPTTAFRYGLSENAAVTITIERVLPGRRSRGRARRCVRPAPRLRRSRRCTRHARQGTLRRKGMAGRNTVRFAGRIGRRSLRPGRYRASFRATDAAGNSSRSRYLNFVVRR